MSENITLVDLYHLKKSDEALRRLLQWLLYRMTYADDQEKSVLSQALEDALEVDQETINQMVAENLERHKKVMARVEKEYMTDTQENTELKDLI